MRRNWLAILGPTCLVLAGYVAQRYGYLGRLNPSVWSPAQWAHLVVSSMGFGVLFFVQHLWWKRQEKLWAEVDQLRSKVEELQRTPTQPFPLPPLIEERDTATFRAVRAAPSGAKEPPTVERVLAGRSFTFRG